MTWLLCFLRMCFLCDNGSVIRLSGWHLLPFHRCWLRRQHYALGTAICMTMNAWNGQIGNRYWANSLFYHRQTFQSNIQPSKWRKHYRISNQRIRWRMSVVAQIIARSLIILPLVWYNSITNNAIGNDYYQSFGHHIRWIIWEKNAFFRFSPHKYVCGVFLSFRLFLCEFNPPTLYSLMRAHVCSKRFLNQNIMLYLLYSFDYHLPLKLLFFGSDQKDRDLFYWFVINDEYHLLKASVTAMAYHNLASTAVQLHGSSLSEWVLIIFWDDFWFVAD